MKEYSKDFDAKVAIEKTAAQAAGDSWPALIDDYGQLRKMCRAIP